jgi:hypothetical protein
MIAQISNAIPSIQPTGVAQNFWWEFFKLLLEYVKVFLSPAVVIGIVVLVFVDKFKKQTGSLIDRINQIKFPGGGEIATSQREATQKALPSNTETPPKSVGEPQLPQNISLTPEQQKQVREVFEAERARAALWEYRYLNFFLARISQEFLDWLAKLPQPPTVELADAFWQAVPVDERRAVLEAVRSHYLVDTSTGQIVVTPKGKEYLQWRGPLPPLSPTR